jgi:uncharacterized protein YutE (UPF0331/DUF86 family)
MTDVELILKKLAFSFRNVLVHGYTAVDPGIVRDILGNRLGDLHAFVVQIRGKLQTP